MRDVKELVPFPKHRQPRGPSLATNAFFYSLLLQFFKGDFWVGERIPNRSQCDRFQTGLKTAMNFRCLSHAKDVGNDKRFSLMETAPRW
jgi:hypothetical protein